jgi:tetratricopeptide (TPR) repeat protein
MRVMELLDVAAGEVDERFGEYPELRSSIQSTIGETYTRLGSYEVAEKQLNDAISAMESLDEAPVVAMASTMVVLAQVQTATTRLDDADATLDRALGLIEGTDAPDELLGQLEHQRGALLYERGEFAESIEVYERAMTRLGDFEEDSTDSFKRIGSQVLIGMGVSLKRLERFEESLEAYERALVLLADVRGENHPDTLACLSNRAEVLNNLGRVEEAETQLWDLVERRKQVFGPTHERVGITLNNLADLLRERGAFDEASGLFDEAIGIFRINPGDPSLRLAITIHNAGVMHLEQTHLERAHEMLEEAATMTGAILPEGHWIHAQFRVKLAECMMLNGEIEDARSMLVGARPNLVAAMGEEHRRVAHVDSLLMQITSMDPD